MSQPEPSRAVSPAVGVLLAVAITVVLSAIVWTLVIGGP